jgi:hypothetical protein
VSGYHYFLDNAAYQFNFADLDDPVPASAYFAGLNCANSGHRGNLSSPNALNGERVELACGNPVNGVEAVIWDA